MLPAVEGYSDRPDLDILPIYVADFDREHPVVTSHQGTGFLVGGNVIVTCWHCVRAELPEGHVYVAVRPDTEGGHSMSPMVEIEQDANGYDLATALIRPEPEMGLTIAESPVLNGTQVWSYGHPLTSVEALAEKDYKRFTPNARYMQSYVMRNFYFDQPGFGRTPSYELDMPLPGGMSGAPLVEAGTREIIGVLYARNDAEEIEEFGSRDPDSGERLTPEVVRMTYFAVAHHTITLWNLRGSATQGLPLGEYLTPPPAAALWLPGDP